MMWKQEPTEVSWEGKANSDTVWMAERVAFANGVLLDVWTRLYLFCVLWGFKSIISQVLFYTSKYCNYLQDENKEAGATLHCDHR